LIPFVAKPKLALKVIVNLSNLICQLIREISAKEITGTGLNDIELKSPTFWFVILGVSTMEENIFRFGFDKVWHSISRRWKKAIKAGTTVGNEGSNNITSIALSSSI